MIVGMGIDIIEISKVKKAIKRWGDHFLNHVFCEEEIIYSQKHKNPYQHFAARFAAKEAVIKALGGEFKVRWKDIKILNHKSGKPFCKFNNKDFKYTILITLSHSDNYAVANAIITA